MFDYNFIILILLILKHSECNEYLLPNIVTPEKYDLQIFSTLYEERPDDFTFKGEVNIDVLCNKKSNKITLHSYELGIEENLSVFHRETCQSIKVTKFDIESKYDFLHIYLEDPIEESEKYIIRIQFYGNISDTMLGFYRSSYTYMDQEIKKTSWLATTQFEPTYARRAFPCFDEPAYKAKFQISLGHNANLIAISNMPLKYRQTLNETYVIDRFQESVIMSTYLIAYLISDFGHLTSPPDLSSTTFKIWARKSALSQAAFAQTTGPRALSLFENYFKIPFPLPKQDMVAIPDFSSGAMENWGLITYRETSLLYDSKNSALDNKKGIAYVICHELAHQWFGNLVTMKWWNDLWLNEGFATYLGVKCVDGLFPKWNYDISESMKLTSIVFEKDSLISSIPLSAKVNNPNEIKELFGDIAYKKGFTVIRMIEKALGEEVLRTGLTNYLNKHRYSNAEQDDLWNALTTEAHKVKAIPNNFSVKKIMDSWTLQIGYPVVNLKRNYKTGLVEVTQERFLQRIKVSDVNSCWWIPFSYTTADVKDFNNTKPHLWLTCPETPSTFEYKQPDNWIIGNIKRTGLFWVNYDEKNWKLIINHLKKKKIDDISEVNRADLVDSIMALAEIGQVDYELALDLLNYLQYEKTPSPWEASFRRLGKIKRIFTRTSHRLLMLVYNSKFVSKMTENMCKNNKINNLTKKFNTIKTIFAMPTMALAIYRTNLESFSPEYMQAILEPMYKKYGGFKLTGKKMLPLHRIITAKACGNKVKICENDALKLFTEYLKNPETFPINKEFRGTIFCKGIRMGGEKEWNFMWQKYLDSNVGNEKILLLQALACTKNKEILERYLHLILEDDQSGIRKQDSMTVFSSIANNRHGYEIAKSFLYKHGQQIIEMVKNKMLGNYINVIAGKITKEDEFETLKQFILDNPGFRKHANIGVNQAFEKVELNIRWYNTHFNKFVEILKKKIPTA